MKPLLNMNECCRLVTTQCPNPYARAYARAWLAGCPGHAHEQALYVLSNTSAWRGPQARVVKEALKHIIKEKL
jgi:ribonuclease D